MKGIEKLAKKAIKEAQKYSPDIDRVIIWEDLRWQFCNDSHETPSFRGVINTDLFEELSDNVLFVPWAFQLENEDNY